MPKPSKEQIEFASRMSPKQWQALIGLKEGPFFLSASERGDPEIYELIRRKLARSSLIEGLGCASHWSWFLTDAGNWIVRRRLARAL